MMKKFLLTTFLLTLFIVTASCRLLAKEALAEIAPGKDAQQAAISGTLYAPSYPTHINWLQQTGSFAMPNWLQSVVGDMPSTISFQIIPAKTDANGNLSMIKGGGAVGFLASGIDTMVKNKPASSIEYIAYETQKLHVPGTPEVAYAAGGGLGFNSLTPVLQIWTVSRNLAYIIFAVVFIVIGVMIMTRQKIDPKTVASIQNALPKIIFALVLVTFSYAIAGFLIDIMYVALGLIVTVMAAAFPNGPKVADILSGSIFSFVFTPGGLFSVSANIAANVFGIVNNILQPVQGISQFVGGLSGGLAFLIVAIAILIALFRTWLSLISAFAHIILAIIFAPLRLMLDAIPGQNQFNAWVRDLLANLLTFPLVTILLAIGAAIAQYQGDVSQKGFAPPLIGAGNTREVLPFVGLGILLTIPKALDILREFLKAPAFKYGNAWSENMKGVLPVAQYGYNTGKWVANTKPVSRATEPIRGRIDEARTKVGETINSFFPKTN